MLKVINVLKNSPAYKLGIRKDDVILRINDELCRDFVDFEYLISNNNLNIVWKNSIGKTFNKRIHIKNYDDFGIEYEQCKCRGCCNKCIFCFIDQLPENMRSSLYFKDDDWRMSFVMGNYVTLTNVGEREFERILKRKVSPIYISVHATDADVRSFILGSKNADIFPRLKQLAEAKIEFDCQAVLVPGINDGDILRKTIEDLSPLYPYARSLALVPVGLTKHRKGLYNIKPFNKEQAADVINIAEEYSSVLLKKTGSRFVFPSDEMYMRAEMPLPDTNAYEQLLQREDGVGFVSSFFDELYNLLETVKIKQKYKIASIACGTDIYPYFVRLSEAVYNKIGTQLNIYPIRNTFFGETITVSGLITGNDLKTQLADKDLGEALFISHTMLRQFEDVFLDDVTLSDLCDILNVNIVPVEPDGYSFIEAISITEE